VSNSVAVFAAAGSSLKWRHFMPMVRDDLAFRRGCLPDAVSRPELHIPGAPRLKREWSLCAALRPNPLELLRISNI
jgi:hypothetical protein